MDLLRSPCLNVCSAENLTKRSSVLLLPLVRFSAEQTLITALGQTALKQQKYTHRTPLHNEKCNPGYDVFNQKNEGEAAFPFFWPISPDRWLELKVS